MADELPRREDSIVPDDTGWLDEGGFETRPYLPTTHALPGRPIQPSQSPAQPRHGHSPAEGLDPGSANFCNPARAPTNACEEIEVLIGWPQQPMALLVAGIARRIGTGHGDWM